MDSTCASVVFSASFVIAGWLLVFAGAARRYLDLPDVAIAVQLLEYGERLRVVARRFERSLPTMETLPADRRVHQETGSRSLQNGNPKAKPFSRLVVSSESNEYCSSPRH